MKNKVLMVLMASLFSLSAIAQTSLVSRYSIPLDTVTNTGVKTLVNKVAVKGALQSVSVSTIVTKVSGTAGGTIILQGSLDGVNFDRIRSANLYGGAAAVDSLIIKDTATQVKNWTVINSPYQFYRTQATGVGTTVFTIQGKYIAH